jgi:hypothetical protein
MNSKIAAAAYLLSRQFSFSPDFLIPAQRSFFAVRAFPAYGEYKKERAQPQAPAHHRLNSIAFSLL